MTCSSCHYSSSRETSQLPSGDACMIWNFELCISGPAIPDVRVLARSCWPYSDGAKKLRHPWHHVGNEDARHGYFRRLPFCAVFDICGVISVGNGITCLPFDRADCPCCMLFYMYCTGRSVSSLAIASPIPPGERDDVSQVCHSRQVAQQAIEAQTKSTMGDAAILTQV